MLSCAKICIVESPVERAILRVPPPVMWPFVNVIWLLVIIRVFQELSLVCSTIDESWDHDPEARLSAECIEARLSQLSHSPSVSDVSVASVPGGSDAKEKVSLVV